MDHAVEAGKQIEERLTAQQVQLVMLHLQRGEFALDKAKQLGGIIEEAMNLLTKAFSGEANPVELTVFANKVTKKLTRFSEQSDELVQRIQALEAQIATGATIH